MFRLDQKTQIDGNYPMAWTPMSGDGITKDFHITDARCRMPTLRFAELAGLSPEERHARLQQFISGRSAPLNGEIGDLDCAIAEYERRFQMSSAAMRDLLLSGRQHETADVCAWMRLVDVRERAAGSTK